MPKPTCPHCGHNLTPAEVKAIAHPAELRHLRRIGSAGGKASSAKVDTKQRAAMASQARWKKHREEQAKKESSK